MSKPRGEQEGGTIIIERTPGKSAYKKENYVQTELHCDSPLNRKLVARKLHFDDPCYECNLF